MVSRASRAHLVDRRGISYAHWSEVVLPELLSVVEDDASSPAGTEVVVVAVGAVPAASVAAVVSVVVGTTFASRAVEIVVAAALVFAR
jgi:hypothetical protein